MSQCWAFDSLRRRCEQDAGHQGDHAILIVWSEDECYKPDVAPEKRPVSRETPDAAEVQQEAPKAKPRCVACQHAHRGGTCKCGCHNHIG